MKPMVIGISGRSGSGKTTLVRNILSDFGSGNITLHTLDNYYLPRVEQSKDDKNYLNFDLPTSFYRSNFEKDLKTLLRGESVLLDEYQFNKEKDIQEKILIPPAPIILVEGLFIFHFQEIMELLDKKVLVELSYKEAFNRRLKRDQIERNYTIEEITYRYEHHVEPSFQRYILPYRNELDLLLTNNFDIRKEAEILYKEISTYLIKKGIE